MKDRVSLLLSRELDGNLSDIERAELDRKILLVPQARRDRASWKKVIGTLKIEPPKQRLPLERMAAQIAAEASTRPQPLSLDRARSVVLAATLAAAGFALMVLMPVSPPVAKPPRPQPTVAVVETEDAPVELTIDEDVEEEVATITTIRF